MTSHQDDAVPPPVGSVGEEAAKLLGALSGWALEHGPHLGEGVEDLVGRVSDSLHDVDEHLATGSAECTVCPICRLVHSVRGLPPEVRGHLAAAAVSLGRAVGAVLSPPPQGGPNDGVEHIDLDDDGPEDEA
jgi:hypothetical protein